MAGNISKAEIIKNIIRKDGRISRYIINQLDKSCHINNRTERVYDDIRKYDS